MLHLLWLDKIMQYIFSDFIDLNKYLKLNNISKFYVDLFDACLLAPQYYCVSY
jgi:hypothetical protein